MSPQQADRVLDWARAGGHLVFVAQALWDEDTEQSGDLLLDRVQIHQMLSEDLEEPPEPEAGDAYPKLTKVHVDGEQAPAYVSFDTAFHLDDPDSLAQSWASSGAATHMIQLEYGKGSVTVLTDADIWKTPAIGRYDNAWLLWYLNVDTTVTLLFNTDHPSLWQLLWKNFPQALVALGLLIGLWLWQAAVRHGPCWSRHPRLVASCSNTCAPAPTSSCATVARVPCCMHCKWISGAGPDAVIPGSNNCNPRPSGKCWRYSASNLSVPSGRRCNPWPDNAFPAPTSATRSPTCKLSGMPYERTPRRTT